MIQPKKNRGCPRKIGDGEIMILRTVVRIMAYAEILWLSGKWEAMNDNQAEESVARRMLKIGLRCASVADKQNLHHL